MELVLEHIMNKVKSKNLPPAAASNMRPGFGSPGGLDQPARWRETDATMPGWTGVLYLLYKRASPGAQVAQLVEQRTENPCVGGSIPPLGTIIL
jgi:hypothetical protein